MKRSSIWQMAGMIVFGMGVALLPVRLIGQEMPEIPLTLESGQTYRFALTQEDLLSASGYGKPLATSAESEFGLTVVGGGGSEPYEIAVSYDRVGETAGAPGDVADLILGRLEVGGWTMVVDGEGVVQEATGPRELFADLEAATTGNPQLASHLRWLKKGLDDEGLRLMMQSDVFVRPPQPMASGTVSERSSRLHSPYFADVRETSWSRFVGMEERMGRPCARFTSQLALEIKDLGELGKLLLGQLSEVAEGVEPTWEPFTEKAEMELCVDVATGLPLEVSASRTYGVEIRITGVPGRAGAVGLSKLTVEERYHLRALEMPGLTP